jgi:hypothetical protein
MSKDISLKIYNYSTSHHNDAVKLIQYIFMCLLISQHRQGKGLCFHNFSHCKVWQKYYFLYIKSNFQPSMLTCFPTLFFILFFRPIHFLLFIFFIFLFPFSPFFTYKDVQWNQVWTFLSYLMCVTSALLSRSHILA